MRKTGRSKHTRTAGVRSADMVYESIRNAILAGDLEPGDRLLEERLAADLGVSRTPVREAIARLEAERFVERTARAGLIVAVVSQREIEDVYAVREVLEGLAARLCAQAASEADRQRLELLEEEMESAAGAGDSEAMFRINREFHDQIGRASRNETLVHFLQQIRFTFDRYGPTTMSHPGRAEDAVLEHRAVIEAISRHDGIGAERLAREHIAAALHVRLLMHTQRHRQPPADDSASPTEPD